MRDAMDKCFDLACLSDRGLRRVPTVHSQSGFRLADKTSRLFCEFELRCGTILVRLRNVRPQTTPHDGGEEAAGIPASHTECVFGRREETQTVAE